MKLRTALCTVVVGIVVAALAGASWSRSAQGTPDKLVVLTFDDGNKTDRTFVGPLLKEYGFGGTVFVNKSGGAFGHPERFMTWEDVRWLHDAGFEVANHTANHKDLRKLSKEQFAEELAAIETGCVEHGIPRPISFCYCGYRVSRAGVEVLAERGYRYARRGVSPEFDASDNGDQGPTYDPGEDHPLLIPTTGASGPNWKTFDQFVSIVNQAKAGKIVVLTFHGIPTDLHPWVHTDLDMFRRYMDYLRDNGFTAIALRDLAKFTDKSTDKNSRARQPSGDPFAPMDRRLRLATEAGKVERDTNGQPTFSWTCHSAQEQKPSAYQILVASSLEKLDADEGDLWDSGKVVSADSSGILYGGGSLQGGKSYVWKVRAWNRPSETIVKRAERVFDKATAGEFAAEKPGSYSTPASWRQN